MGIDTAHYHGWHGRLRSPWFGCLAIIRVALMQLFRRKLYWVVLGLGLLHFLMCFAIIYVQTQFPLPPQAMNRLVQFVGFSPTPVDGVERGYTMFMERQSYVVMILLAFSGSLLVGSDFRQKTLPFYLSRSIDRRHYIAGKLVAIAVVASLLTVVPALVLFVEYGLFTESFDYWVDHWQAAAGVLVYGLVLCGVLSLMLTSFAAYVQRAAPIAIIWTSVFLLLTRLTDWLADRSNEPAWKLLDMWHNMHAVGTWWLQPPTDPAEQTLMFQSLAVIVAVCVVALGFLVRRVRAVDIVS